MSIAISDSTISLVLHTTTHALCRRKRRDQFDHRDIKRCCKVKLNGSERRVYRRRRVLLLLQTGRGDVVVGGDAGRRRDGTLRFSTDRLWDRTAQLRRDLGPDASELHSLYTHKISPVRDCGRLRTPPPPGECYCNRKSICKLN